MGWDITSGFGGRGDIMVDRKGKEIIYSILSAGINLERTWQVFRKLI